MSYNRPKQRYCGFGWVAVLGYFGQVENPSYPLFFHTPNYTVESSTEVSKLLSTQEKFLFKGKYKKYKQWKSLFTNSQKAYILEVQPKFNGWNIISMYGIVDPYLKIDHSK